MRFATISKTLFDELQVEAGVILSNFDPATGEFADEDIVCATTGGITVNVKPSYSDFGEDVDNVPANTKELKRIDDVEVSIVTTALNITEASLRTQLGAADKDLTTGAFVPRKELKTTDFKTLWYVGDLSNGGFVAVKVENALSTDGFSLKTAKKGKGNIGLTLTGHYSIDDVSKVPVEIYLGEPEDGSIVLNKSSLTMAADDVAVITISASPKSLYDDLTATITGAGATVELSTDKTSAIVTATAEGTPTLTIASGTVSASCAITVEGEG